ncbi:unnamed protein product [Albugo candida]|uniref:Uncharacterized protein n=1 Tax=Albugo candida TaxID=65357 RepID=A0A024G9M4_9STRA|nr:unnamed protein product [Albugo candida]|eukprot:CCI43250.1 unnamed protein product [Albugo candida]
MTAWSFLSDGMPCIASLRISASDGTIELEVRHLLHAFDGDDVNVDKASRKGKVKLKEHKRTYPFQHDASESMEIKTVKKVFVESISMYGKELPLIVLAQPHDASYGNSDGISQSHSSTSLYFYILMKTWSPQQGGESWKLELYSTLTLESNNATASTLQMILLDGPFLVIFDHASGYILVVHASMDDTLPFEIVLTGKISPPALWSKMRLDDGSFRRTEFSCQRFHYSEDSDYILAHIILSSSSTQNTSIYSDGVENYHFWTRLCIAKNTGKSDSGNRCGEHWLNEYCGRKGQEQVTCAFIAPKNKIESFSPFTQTCSFPAPDEYMMVGTTHNRLKLYQNNVLCASSDLLATPRDIIMLAHRSSLDEESGAIVCAVYCSDIAASCFIVFIERSQKKMLRLRLSQHFEYVGEIFTCHLDPESIQIILSNVVREKNISLSDFVVEKFHHAIVMSLQEQTGWDAFHLTCKKVILKRTFEDDSDTVRQLRKIESSQDVPLLPLHVRRVEKYLNKNKSTHLPATFGDKLRQDTQQLANLLRSLEIRVELGKRELERTESIVRDKLNLVAHMNSLLIDQYNDTQKTLQGKNMTLSRTLLENIPYRRLSLGSHKASMIQVISVDAQAREGMRRKPQPVDTVPMHADLGSKAAGNHSYEVFAIISHSITLFDPSQSTISLQLEIRNGSSVSLTQAFVTICTSCSTCNQNGSKIPAKSYSVSSIQTLAASKSANFSVDWKVPVVWNSTFYDFEAYEMKAFAKKQSKDKHRSKDHGRNPLTDGEYMRKERQAAQECQDKDEFIALLQRMDTEKVHAMRSQEQLRVQMQIFNKAGNVEEGRRMEQFLIKTT